MTKIKEIESFDWPSKKQEIKKHTFSPVKKKFQWVWIVLASIILFGLATRYFEVTVLDSMLQKAEAHYDDPCENLEAYINGSEFKEYCYGTP